jgi:hypothetical protein
MVLSRDFSLAQSRDKPRIPILADKKHYFFMIKPPLLLVKPWLNQHS